MKFLRLKQVGALVLYWTAITSMAERPVVSHHRKGPTGLEGWTLSYTMPGAESQGPLATTLVLARNGRILRRLSGNPLVFKWLFLADGKRVALESGPLHFGLTCELVDVSSGKEISSYDCYHQLESGGPDWVKSLQRSGR